MNQVKKHIPTLTSVILQIVSMLVLQLEERKKYPLCQLYRNPAKEFPKGMIFLAAM